MGKLETGHRNLAAGVLWVCVQYGHKALKQFLETGHRNCFLTEKKLLSNRKKIRNRS
jgi:hypothetical protein